METHNQEASVHKWKISVSYREKNLVQNFIQRDSFHFLNPPNLDFPLKL